MMLNPPLVKELCSSRERSIGITIWALQHFASEFFLCHIPYITLLIALQLQVRAQLFQ